MGPRRADNEPVKTRRLRDVAWHVRAMPKWVLRRPGTTEQRSFRSWLLDIGLAAGLALVAILSHDQSDQPDLGPLGGPGAPAPPVFPPPSELSDQTSFWDWAGPALLLVMIAAPLVFRRRYPLSTLWVVLLMATMVTEHPDALRLSFYACVIAAYSAAVYSPYRVLALLSLPVTAFLMGELQDDSAQPALGGAINAVPPGAVPFLILAPIAVAAWGLRTMQDRADAEQAHVVTLQREGAEAVRRAAEEERARIARELHDVVTHNVSVMVIQAGAARKVTGRVAGPGSRGAAVGRGERTGGDDRAAARDGAADRGRRGRWTWPPSPGLAELESLVGRVRASGLPVELAVTGVTGHPDAGRRRPGRRTASCRRR